jgi:hypothetical protein
MTIPTDDRQNNTASKRQLVVMDAERAPQAGVIEIGPGQRLSRSPFLAQLARQYETRDDASKRRRETRQQATSSYTNRPKPSRSRHVTWV